jgi:hypothetical protein
VNKAALHDDTVAMQNDNLRVGGGGEELLSPISIAPVADFESRGSSLAGSDSQIARCLRCRSATRLTNPIDLA